MGNAVENTTDTVTTDEDFFSENSIDLGQVSSRETSSGQISPRETSSLTPTSIKSIKRKKKDPLSNLRKAAMHRCLDILNAPALDECSTFWEFVAKELRSIKSNNAVLFSQTKKKICQILIEAGDELLFQDNIIIEENDSS